MSDPGLSEDQIVQLIVVAMVVAHVGVLIWYWMRRNLTPVVALNLLLSGGVIAYWLPRAGELFNYVDMVTAFVAFELAVLVTSVAAAVTPRVPRWLVLAEFAVNALLSAGALYFLLTFTITRLI